MVSASDKCTGFNTATDEAALLDKYMTLYCAVDVLHPRSPARPWNTNLLILSTVRKQG